MVSKKNDFIDEYINEDSNSVDLVAMIMNHLEVNWTKRSLLNYFSDNLSTELIKYSGQVAATFSVLRKSLFTVNLVEEWIKISNIDNFLNDNLSDSDLNPDLIEHRHDQSIFSLLCKGKNVDYLFTNEYFTVNNWESLGEKPIWVKGDKDFGIIERVINFIRRQVLQITKG